MNYSDVCKCANNKAERKHHSFLAQMVYIKAVNDNIYQSSFQHQEAVAQGPHRYWQDNNQQLCCISTNCCSI